MLTNMEVYSPRVSVPLLPVSTEGLSADPIQIRNIDGLGPVDANIGTSPFGSVDGESYSGSSVGKRNIVLTLGLNPDWKVQTIASLRRLLYEYFMPKQAVILRFFSDDMPTVDIRGYAETMEPNIFSEDPELQISIICPLPDFVAVEETVVASTVGDGSVLTPIKYLGTVPTGFVLQVKNLPNPPWYTEAVSVIRHTPYLEVFTAVGPVDSNEYFEMSSRQGQKYVHAVKWSDRTIRNLLRTTAVNVVWPKLDPGLNEFSVTQDHPGSPWSLTYFAHFGGL